MAGRVLVGTSGWSYPHWAGVFYPEDLPRSDWFAHYVRHFPTVEVNATFYRLPSSSMIRRWREQSPPGFRFSVKGSRYVTHRRRLADPGEGVERFFDRVGGLGESLAVVLWQTPPSLERNLDVLESFLSRLPRNVRHAFEFRHRSWVDEVTFQLLARHDAAWVSASGGPLHEIRQVTTDFVYARFHDLGEGRYPDALLDVWADWLASQAEAGRDGYAYFNNDVAGHAPRDATRLAAALRRRGVTGSDLPQSWR